MSRRRARGVLLMVVLAAASLHAALAAEIRPGKEPEWRLRTRKKLEEQVACRFRKVSLKTAISALQRQTDIAFTLDAGALGASRGRRVECATDKDALASALRSVLEQAGLDYVLTDQAMFISTRERIEWILRLAGFSYTLKDEAIWISTPDRALAGLRPQPKPEAGKAAPESQRGPRELLQRKVSFELVDTPLSETIQLLQTVARCSMILDPRAVEERGNTPINLRVEDMSLELVLD